MSTNCLALRNFINHISSLLAVLQDYSFSPAVFTVFTHGEAKNKYWLTHKRKYDLYICFEYLIHIHTFNNNLHRDKKCKNENYLSLCVQYIGAYFKYVSYIYVSYRKNTFILFILHYYA